MIEQSLDRGSAAAPGAAAHEGVMARIAVRGGANRWVAAFWMARLGGANLFVVAPLALVKSR